MPERPRSKSELKRLFTNLRRKLITDNMMSILIDVLWRDRVQSDWNQTDQYQEDFIKNKPAIIGGSAAVSGLGMDFETGAPVDLGLPSTINNTTENALTAHSHTHKLGDVLLETIVDFEPVEDGALYNWWVIADARKITSSDDWDVITYDDAHALMLQVDPAGFDYMNTAGPAFKEPGTAHWLHDEGLNTLGLTILGSGYRSVDPGNFITKKITCSVWTKTLDENGYPIRFTLATNQQSIGIYPTYKYEGASIRLRRNSSRPNGWKGNYMGNNGYIYSTVVQNGVEYTCENLNETNYRNGDWVTGFDSGVYTPITNENWILLETEAMCYYDDIVEINGAPESIAVSFYDIASKSHAQNTDTKLDEGGDNEVTAAQAKAAYTHSGITHAPTNAQKNSDITKGEIEAKLTGIISTHSHIPFDLLTEFNPWMPETEYAAGDKIFFDESGYVYYGVYKTAHTSSTVFDSDNLAVVFVMIPPTETDPIVGAISGIVKANGAGVISAAAKADIEAILTGNITTHTHDIYVTQQQIEGMI